MSTLEAVVLGLVQGLGEFLPISSSAHLILVPWLFRWPDPGLAFDVALHLGTLVAVLLFFWRDWVRLLAGALKGRKNRDGQLFWYLVIATIPGAVFGYLFENKAETVFRTPLLIAIMLIVMGIILYYADRKGAKEIELGGIDFVTSFVIGLSQALAIIPGVSRSGVTMSAALLLGLKREDAARFSFLLSTPIILGAGLAKLPDIIAHPSLMGSSFMIGMLVSAVAGLVSIGFLLRFVQYKDYKPFAWYRFALGVLVIAVALMRG